MSSHCIPCTGSGDNASQFCHIKSDYRAFTDYTPKCAQVYKQTQANQFASSYDMREWLIHNADDIMKQNALDAYMNMQCKCVEPYDQGTMLPELQKQTCTDRVCTFNVNDKYGLGLGRQFYDPSTEKEFRGKFVAEKEKEQRAFKEGSCCGTANDTQYWPIDGTSITNYDRYSVPSGGQQLSVGGIPRQV